MNANKKLKSHFGKIEKSKFLTLAEQWEKEKGWKERSQEIAFELIDFLDEKGMTQKTLAALMGVSPQVVNKWLKGQENFTLETIGRMEVVIGRRLIEIIDNETKHPVMTEELMSTVEAYPQTPAQQTPNFDFSAKVVSIQSKYKEALGC